MELKSHRVRAWISNDFYGPDDIVRDGPKAAERLAYQQHDMSSIGWTPVGYADITLHLDDQDKLVQNKLDALRSQKTKIQADAANEVTAIDRKINELLALPLAGATP